MIWLGIGLLWVGMIGWFYWRTRDVNSLASDLLMGGLLFGLTMGFFWRVVSGDVYQPADGGDLVSFLYPTYRFAAAQLQQGVLPLWNPTLYAGAPFIGDIQAGFLYIPNLILLLLWPDFPYPVMQWLAIGHLYWAGLGMYVLLRTWHGPNGLPVSRMAALFGALAFTFCDPLLIHLGNLNLIAVLSWLPWIVATYHLALYHRSLRWAAVAGFLFAFATFAGHAQSTIYIGLILALYTLGHWGLKANVWRSTGQLRRVTLPQVIAVLQYPLITATITALLTAPVVLPALELARYTERNTFTYQDTVAFSLAPTQAIGLLTPGFFGHGPALHWSLWSRVETPYAGVVTLVLAVAALVLAKPALRQRLWVWVLIAGAGFVTALGIYAIVHGLLTVLVPLFEQFRAPARSLVLWTFGLAVLAAIGLDVIRSQWMLAHEEVDAWGTETLTNFLRWGAVGLTGIAVPLAYFALLLTQENETAFLRASVAALALTLAAGLWLATWALIAMGRAGWISPTIWGGLLVALLFFDLSAVGAYTDISSTDPTSGYEHPAIVEFLRNEPNVGRIDTLTNIRSWWQPDSAALYGLEDVGGIANPLMLDHWRQLWESLGGRHSKLYDMLHVTHVVVQDGTPLPEGKFEQVLDAPGELALYHNNAAMPRVWLVHDVRVAVTDAEIWEMLQAPDFDPTRHAIVRKETVPTDAIIGEAAEGTNAAQVIEQTPTTLTVQVQSEQSALLILSEIWYPGWRATVNGEAAEVWQTNGALRSVVVPAGESTVALWFAPDSWRIGLLSAIAGWLLFIAIFILGK